MDCACKHTHIISLTMDDIVNTAIAQSSADFRAMRSTATEQSAGADNIYEDFVITPDDKPLIVEQVRGVVPSLYQSVRAYSPKYYADDEAVMFNIVAQDCNAGQRLTELVRKCIVWNILGWWYELRSAELSARYYEKSAGVVSDILSVVIPQFTERRLRYF